MNTLRKISRIFDTRTVVYGIVLPVAVYFTVAMSLQSRSERVGQTTQQLRTGTEIVSVLITSSTCAGNRYPGFQDIIREVNAGLETKGKKEGWTPRRVGVALDWNIEQGMEALRAFGPWDEVAIGNNWLNTAAMRYMVVDIPGRLTIPQIILVKREIVNERGKPLQVRSETEVGRIVGADEIEEWLRAGLPLQARQAKEAVPAR